MNIHMRQLVVGAALIGAAAAGGALAASALTPGPSAATQATQATQAIDLNGTATGPTNASGTPADDLRAEDDASEDDYHGRRGHSEGHDDDEADDEADDDMPASDQNA